MTTKRSDVARRDTGEAWDTRRGIHSGAIVVDHYCFELFFKKQALHHFKLSGANGFFLFLKSNL